jgi:hypothetical protein
VFAGSRLVTLALIGVLGIVRHRPLGSLLLSWDSGWYVGLARYGYPHTVAAAYGRGGQNGLGFFPALPLGIRFVHDATGLDYPAAGLVLASVAGLGGAMLLCRLLEEVEGRGALRGTALVVLSPAAFVLSLVYGEGLLLAAASGCLLALRRGRWWVAGLCAAVAGATDPLGVAIAAPCLLAALPAARRGRRSALGAPVLALTGVGGFFGYLWLHAGTPWAWFDAQRHGWQHGRFGGGVFSALSAFLRDGPAGVDAMVKVISTVIVLGLLVGWLRRPGWRPDRLAAAYVLAVLVLALLSPVVAWSPRVLLRAFPLLGIVGARLRPRAAVLACCLSGLAMLAMAVASLGLPVQLAP